MLKMKSAKQKVTRILIVAGCDGGAPEQGFYDALACAILLAEENLAALQVLLMGEGGEKVGRKIATQEGIAVTVLCGAGLWPYTDEVYRQVLSEEIESLRPAYVLTPHGARGAEWAPALAAELGCGCISAIDGVRLGEHGICFQKDLYGGKVKGLFAPAAGTTFLTIQPGVFPHRRSTASGQGSFETKNLRVSRRRCAHLGSEPAPGGASDLHTAAIIVAVGNGIGSQENLALIQELAARLPQAAVAGSRIVCDRGWLGYGQQVGVTGATVAPALYLACGISGASQHRAGMRGSQFVVAINTDPGAPIFNEADICIVEDLTTFIPLLLTLLS
jgi:electron transfer flavoprotein alpha subunit